MTCLPGSTSSAAALPPLPQRRSTFRHGNLHEALIQAARQRIELQGPATITLRELARDTGVNHRAIYRHFPDKETLLVEVVERGWREFTEQLRLATAAAGTGESVLVAAGLAIFGHGCEHPNFFRFATGPQFSPATGWPRLGSATTDALEVVAAGVAAAGIDPALAPTRAAFYMAAVQGITAQYINGRLRVSRDLTTCWIDTGCRILVRGLLSESSEESAAVSLRAPAEIARNDATPARCAS